ncbi:MAG: InlB B-repeat-containing protein [Clostridiales bacterium]|nr:InlB B-repeat-containing protein [Clostridiales bacterium]
MRRKIISLFLALTLCVGIMPAVALAATGTFYLEDGSVTITSDSSGGYSVTQGGSTTSCTSVVITNRDSDTATENNITVSGKAEFTLENVNISTSTGSGIEIGDSTAVITVSGTNIVTSGDSAGIHVSSGNLTINASSTSDSITVTAGGSGVSGTAGIGSNSNEEMSGSITIENGTVNSTGSGFGAGIGSGAYGKLSGSITITGGTVTVTGGGSSAGIGTGYNGELSGNIIITGGTVIGTGGDGTGAGIGTGSESTLSGNIIITGGEVSGTSGSGAGIGAGYTSTLSGNIIITGGTVTGTSTSSGAGIGTGNIGAMSGYITIIGGEVSGTSGAWGAGIGTGEEGDMSGYITITDGTVSGTSNGNGAGIGTGDGGDMSGDITITGGEVSGTSGGYGAGIGTGRDGAMSGIIRILDDADVTATGDGSIIGAGYGETDSGKYYMSSGATRNSRDTQTWNMAGEYVLTTNKDATCIENGYATYKNSETSDEYTIISLATGHSLTYTADEDTITEKCDNCDYSAMATISAPTDLVYDGNAKAATVAYDTDWLGGTLTVTYQNSSSSAVDADNVVNVGTYTAQITVGGATAKVSFAITAAQLATPTGLAWNDSTATWDSVANASSYSVQLYKDGTAEGNSVTTTDTSYTFIITEARSYTFKVTAVGEGNYSNSGTAISDELSFYTMTFDTNGGGTIDSQIVAEGSKATQPATPTKSGYNFAGWYSNSECTEQWTFNTNTVTSDITLYAKWSGETVYEISGTVTDKSGNALSGIDITLQQGNDVILKTKTDSTGAFSFSGVSAGLYNLVAQRTENGTSQTVTVLEEITNSNDTGKTIKLSDINVNSELTVSDTSADGDVDAHLIVVGGLNDEAQAVADADGITDGTHVTVAMTVESQTENSSDTTQQAIKNIADSQYFNFIQFDVTKTIGDNKTNVTKTKTVLEIVVPYDFSGKNDITVYRYHDSSAEVLTSTSGRSDNPTESTFYLDETNGMIHIFASKFSLYAIGYSTTSSSSSSSSSRSHSSYSLEEKTSSSTTTDTADDTPIIGSIEESIFTDVSTSASYYEAVKSAYEKGYMVGIADGLFGPDMHLTRAMAAQIIWNMAGNPTPGDVAPFLDVTSDTWYAEAVAWCYENSIVVGYDDTTYGPEDYLTEEQFERMLDIFNGIVPADYTGDSSNATRSWVAEKIYDEIL